MCGRPFWRSEGVLTIFYGICNCQNMTYDPDSCSGDCNRYRKIHTDMTLISQTQERSYAWFVENSTGNTGDLFYGDRFPKNITVYFKPSESNQVESPMCVESITLTSIYLVFPASAVPLKTQRIFSYPDVNGKPSVRLTPIPTMTSMSLSQFRSFNPMYLNLLISSAMYSLTWNIRK